ncbi:mechanosensitive ion channel family protein [Pseudomaricurvus sp.]|uniref:mechanosensitive ion channel family protein n=1 Tax=Pseudomaricurvus sp. TaxID=2004510 RepID=UPI003F6D76C4
MKQLTTRYIFLAILSLTVALSSNPVIAQTEQQPSSSSEQPSSNSTQSEEKSGEKDLAEAVSETDINSLIELLESKTARTQFLERLKALAKAQEEGNQDDSLAVSKILDLDSSSGALANHYSEMLDYLGITDSQLGRILTTFGVIVFLGLIVLFIRITCRWLNHKLDKVRTRYSLERGRLTLLTTIPVKVSYAFFIALILSAIAEIWGLSWFLPGGKLAYPDFLHFVLTFSVIVYVFAALWESTNAGLEYMMRNSRQMSGARIDTVLPVIRKVIFLFFVILFGLIALSELGIDIVPLLAGAGVFGIALGFGAQTLVQDFLVGFIIILEDLLQIGDIVKVSDRMGTVEKITIRKLQLRDLDGTVHTVPFSQLDIIENYTKDYSYYLSDVGVAYKEDIDEVIDCIKSVSEDLQGDDVFGEMMLEDIEILGLDKFADSALVIRVRLKTRAHDKWNLGREFNRRLKYAFDDKGIEIPFPHRTLMLGEDIGAKLQVPKEHEQHEQQDNQDNQESQKGDSS